MKKIKKMAAVIILILIAFIYGHIHKTHAIYDRTVENDQYIMLDGSQSQITQRFEFIFRIVKMEELSQNL